MSARGDVRFTSQAKKDVDRLSPKLKDKPRDILLEVLTENPYEGSGRSEISVAATRPA
jgi:mRNA-degrading endonuclease RelE of RelBE toxin-antitoxin system